VGPKASRAVGKQKMLNYVMRVGTKAAENNLQKLIAARPSEQHGLHVRWGESATGRQLNACGKVLQLHMKIAVEWATRQT